MTTKPIDCLMINGVQRRVRRWVETVFDNQIGDVKLRAARFLEEAAEAAQAAGLHRDDADLVLTQVYGRPPGRLVQEIGGAMTTLCALASAANIDLAGATLDEMARMETPEIIEKVRRRQSEKVTPR